MKDAFYFPHDSNAKDDPKCMVLIDQLGLEGYGIFWVLIETLKDQPDYKYPINLVPILARRYGTSAEKMLAVVSNYNFFVFDEEKNFFSLSLNRRMQKLENSREQRRQAGLKSAEKRKSIMQNYSNENSTTVQRPFNENSTTVQQVKESKVEERKEKKIKLNESKEEILCPKNKNFLDFYNNQFIENQNEPLIKEYEYLFKYLLNEIKNEINKPLEWLKLEYQLTYNQFTKLKEISKEKNVKIMDMIKLGENVPSYLLKKKKISVYLTLRNWLNSNINYSNYTKNQQTNNLLTMKNPYKNEITQIKQHN